MKPKLLDTVMLRVDCSAVGSPGDTSSLRVIPCGSRGVLVDQSVSMPSIWTIEFFLTGDAGLVLVEASEEQFVVCEKV